MMKWRKKGGGESGSAGRGMLGSVASSPGQIIFVAVLALFLMGSLIIPLQSYADQRSQLAEANANIARLEAQKTALEEEMDMYSDEAYIREQARVRLGLVDPGETAFRLIDPAISDDLAAEDPDEDAEHGLTWYQILWNSIAVPPTPDTIDDGAVREESTSPDRVPRIHEDEAPAVPE